MIKNHIVSDSSQIYFDFDRAEGSFIWDRNGKKFIDFSAGWNVCNLGWNNPEVNQAIKDQLEKNTYSPFFTNDQIHIDYAKALTNALPEELDVVVRATGGTEANEEAIKIARAYTGKKKIIGFKNAYHGQSSQELAIVYSPTQIMGSTPSDMIQIDFPNIDQQKSDEEILVKFENDFRDALKNNDVAAVLTEAGIVTGGGQTYVAPIGFMKVIKKIADEYGVLIILDEVGTGFSRCGKLFGMEIEGVVPDIATFAKAMCNGGAAIGALATREEIIKKTENQAVLISTFGWTQLATAASLKTLEIHLRDKVWEKAEKDGDYIIQILKERLGDNSKIKSIRGCGMEIGVLFNEGINVREIYQKIFDKGLLAAIDGSNLQLMPPLTIEREVLDNGLKIFIDVIEE